MKKALLAVLVSAIILNSCNSSKADDTNNQAKSHSATSSHVSSDTQTPPSSQESDTQTSSKVSDIEDEFQKLDITEEEYWDVYNNVPYEHFYSHLINIYSYPSILNIYETDELAGEMRNVLFNLFYLSIPEEFSAPQVADTSFVLFSSIHNTVRCSFYDDPAYESGSLIYSTQHVEGFRPLTKIDIYECYLESHLKQTTLNLFGEELELGNGSKFISYNHTFKIYQVQAVGFYTTFVPEITNYTEVDDGYEVEFVFVINGMDDTYFNDDGDLVEESDLIDYLNNSAQRYKSKLVPDGSESFYVRSFEKI